MQHTSKTDSAQLKTRKRTNSNQPEHTKPIFINNGEDSIRNMSLPTSGSMNTVEVLKKQLLSLFGEEENKKK